MVHEWGFDVQGEPWATQREIDSHVCSSHELGLESNGNDDGKFFKIRDSSRKIVTEFQS